MKEETWDDGKLLEISPYTDEDGNELNTGTLTNGNGHVTNYRPDGTLFSGGAYRNGLPNGSWTFYDEKGRKLTSGQLADGVKEGIWLIFTRSGKIKETELYEDGELKMD